VADVIRRLGQELWDPIPDIGLLTSPGPAAMHAHPDDAAGVGQFVVTQIAEASILMLKDWLVAGKIHYCSKDAPIFDLPQELVVRVQDD
jgi:hypothetical protein